MNRIESRLYQASDKQQCIEIFQSNIGLYFAKEEQKDFVEFLEAQTSNFYYHVFYEANNPQSIIACGGFGELNEGIFLRWGLVDNHLHKKGLGTKLLLLRLELVKKHLGEVAVLIDTSQHAQGFYEKFGFRVESTIKDGFATNIDTVRMIFENWAGKS